MYLYIYSNMDDITQMILDLPDDMPHRDFFNILFQMGEGAVIQTAELMNNRLRSINPAQQPALFKQIRERRDLARLARREQFLKPREIKKRKQGGYEAPAKRYDNDEEDMPPPSNLFGTGLQKKVVMKGKHIYINMK